MQHTKPKPNASNGLSRKEFGENASDVVEVKNFKEAQGNGYGGRGWKFQLR